jgi:hypothetical protein
MDLDDFEDSDDITPFRKPRSYCGGLKKVGAGFQDLKPLSTPGRTGDTKSNNVDISIQTKRVESSVLP